MHQVFGIVEHDGLGAAAPLGFEPDQRRVQPVETVRLRGGPVTIDGDGVHARVGDLPDRCRGRRVVAVLTHHQREVRVRQPVQGGPKHLADHRGLVPRGDEHDQPAGLGGRAQAAHVGTRVAVVDGPRAPAPPSEVEEVHREVVQREQQETRRGEQRELVGDRLKQPGGHGRDPCRSGERYSGVIFPLTTQQTPSRPLPVPAPLLRQR